MLKPELAAIGKLANPPERRDGRNGRNGEPVAILQLLVEGLGKENGEAKPAWLRTTCFGALAQTALATFRKGDAIFVRGSVTLDRWTNKAGEPCTGLSLVAAEAIRIGTVLRPAIASEIVTAPPPPVPSSPPKAVPARQDWLGEGGLPKGPTSYQAIRVKREDWQAPLSWTPEDDDDLAKGMEK